MSEFTDWALNEECNTYDECAGYSAFIDQNRAVFQVGGEGPAEEANDDEVVDAEIVDEKG